MSPASSAPPAAPPLLRLDPRARVIATLMVAVAVVALARLGPLAVAALLALGLAVAARLPLIPTLKRVAAMDAIIVVLLVSLPFTTAGTPLVTLAGLPASREGLMLAAAIALKAHAVMLTALTLVGTLAEWQLGHALYRLRVPAKLVHVLLFTARYVAVLDQELARLRTAMRARAFVPASTRHTWRSYGYLVGMVLVRSVERAERVVLAMKCRGFEGRLPLPADLRAGAADGAFLAVTGLVIASLLLGDRLLGDSLW